MTAPVNYVLSHRALDDRTELLSVEGDTSLAAAEGLRRNVRELLEQGKGLVIVDLSGVSFVDSAVVQALADIGSVHPTARIVVVEPIDPKIAAPLEHAVFPTSVSVVPTLAAAARAAAMPAAELRSAIPASPPARQEPSRPRRALFGRRQMDQEILSELGQLRRAVKELSREGGAHAAVDIPDDGRMEALQGELAAARDEADRMEAEAEHAHARIQRLEVERDEARSEADRAESEAEEAHARIQALEGDLAAARQAADALRNELDVGGEAAARVQMLETDLARAQTEAEGLRADLEEAQRSGPATAESTIAELRAELEAAREWRETARAELEQARAEADRMEAEAEAAHARIHQLESELAARRDTPGEPDSEAEPIAPDRDPDPAPVPIAQASGPEPAPPAPVPIDEPPDDGPRPLVPVWADPRPINLSTAGLEELMLLPGIGRRPAERIIAFREEHGLSRIDDLYAIDEIPNERITRIRPYVRV